MKQHKHHSLLWHKIQPFIYPILLFLILLFVWEYVTRNGKINPWILPAPTAILHALFAERQLLWHHGLTTALETVAGVMAAMLVGIILAVILEMSNLLKRMLYPYLIISQTVPIISVAPLLILWLGYGIQAKIVIVALVCFFPITLSLLNGFRTVDANQIKLLQTMGATNWQIFTKVKLPATMPFLFAGLKLSATYSVMAAIIGEWLGAMRGLGIYMTRSSHSFLTGNVFAAILLIVVLSFAFYLVIVLLERLCIPWHYEKSDEFYED